MARKRKVHPAPAEGSIPRKKAREAVREAMLPDSGGEYICEMTRDELKEELRARRRHYEEVRAIVHMNQRRLQWAYARYQAVLTALEAEDA